MASLLFTVLIKQELIPTTKQSEGGLVYLYNTYERDDRIKSRIWRCWTYEIFGYIQLPYEDMYL